MKEFAAVFESEVFRPIVTLLVPGAWGIGPLLVALFFWNPHIWDFVIAHKNGDTFILIAIATAFGLVLEDLGSGIEKSHCDRLNDGVDTVWNQYLRLAPERETMGLVYLQSVLTRMKFELSMCVAGIPAFIGILLTPLHVIPKICTIIGIAAFTTYFFCESKDSVKVLHSTRKAIVENSGDNSMRKPIEITVKLVTK